jgi:hypothetical protein
MQRPGTLVLPILLFSSAQVRRLSERRVLEILKSGRLGVYPGFLGGSEARYANGSLDERRV